MKKVAFYLLIVLSLLSHTITKGQTCTVTVQTTPASCSNSADGTATVLVDGIPVPPGSGNPGTPSTCAPVITTDTPCTSCTQTISSNTGTINVGPGQKVCVTSTNFTGTINITGGTLVVCGKITPSAFNLNPGSNNFTVVVNGTAVFGSLNMHARGTVKNYGTITCNNSSGYNGILRNYGTLTSNGDFSVNASSGQISNYKTFQVTGSFNNYNATLNEGTFTVSNNWHNNSGSSLTNKCQVNAGNEFIINAGTSVTNQGNIQAANWIRVNGTGSYKGDAGSWLTTANLIADGTIQGIGANNCAIVRVSGNTTLNGSSIISGKLDLCDANGIETKYGQIQAPATTNCSCQGAMTWNSPLSGGQNPYTGLPPDTYTVIVDVTGCPVTTATFTITSPPPLVASVSVDGNVATATVSGGTPGTTGYTYSWSGESGTSSTQTYLIPGTYTLTAKDSNGCTATATFTIGCDITVVTTPATCSDSANGTVTIYVNGNPLPPGQTNPETPATCAAPKNTDEPCSACTQPYSSNTGTVNVGPGQKICITSSNFTGIINVSGGTLVVCGKITPSAFNLNTNGAPFTMVVNGEAVFGSLNMLPNITVKNFGTIRCTGSSGFNGVLENYGTILSNGDFNVNASNGQVKNYKAFEVTGSFNNYNTTINEGTFKVSNNWHNNSGSALTNKCQVNVGNDFIINASSSISNQGNIHVTDETTVNGTGTYEGSTGSFLVTGNLMLNGILRGSNTNTSCAMVRISNTTTVNSSALISGKIDVCDATGIETMGGTVQAPATTNCSCQGMMTWNSPLSGGQNPYTGLAPGTYTVTVNAPGCPSTPVTFTITSPPPVVVATSVIEKTATASAIGGNPGGYTYAWSGGIGNDNIRTFVNNGTYIVTATDTKGCTGKDTFDIGNNPPCDSAEIVVTYTTDDKVIITCSNEGGCPVVTGNTTLPPGTPIPIPLGVDTTIIITTPCGEMGIPVMNGTEGCAGTIRLKGINPTCYQSTNGRITATVIDEPSATYQWNGPGVTNVTGATIQNLGVGNYTVIATFGTPETCALKAGMKLFQPAALSAVHQLTGVNTVNIVVSGGTPNYTVNWRHDNVVADSRNDLQEGLTYIVDITDKKGCTYTYTFVYQPCALSPLDVYVILDGRNATSVVNGGTTYNYFWDPENSSTILANPYTAHQTNLPDGTYKLIVTDGSSNCKSEATVIVPECGLISASVSADMLPSDPNTCNGQLRVNVTPLEAGTVIIWNGNSGVNELILRNACSGTHSVLVITPNGCAVSRSFRLDPSGAPGNPCDVLPIQLSERSRVEKKCLSDESFVDVLVTGGVGHISYSWKYYAPGETTYQTFSSTSEDLLNPLPGRYILEAVDSRECSPATLEIEIDGPFSELSADKTLSPVLCAGGTASATIVITGGQEPFTVAWPDGSSLLTRNDLAPGNYRVTVTDNLGCETGVSINVPSSVFNGKIASSQRTICVDNGEKTTLTAAPLEGYTYSWSGPGITGPYNQRSVTTGLTGTYTVQYIRSGCTPQSLTVSITDECNPGISCHPVDLGDVPYKGPENCIAQQMIAAEAYATYSYKNYIEEEKRRFKSEYINSILANAEESLIMEYSDQENLYTLYYYDQAGNLVRTVPPAGVKILNEQQVTQAENDLKEDTVRLYTEHTLASTYRYNSLNQVIAQDIPDNNRQDLWETTAANIALGAGQQVSTVEFGNSNTGVLIANNSNSGSVYLSDDGINWYERMNLGVSDLLDIQKASDNANVAYAVGKEGMILKSTDGGTTWIIRNSPTTDDIIRLHFTNSNSGSILTSTGALWNTTNGGNNWTLRTNGPANIGQITDAAFVGTNVYLSASNSGGHIWFYNGTSWSEQSFRPGVLNTINPTGNGSVAGGPLGSLFTIAPNGNISVTRTTLPALKKIIKPNGYFAVTTGNALYSGNASGTSWISRALMTGTTTIHNVRYAASPIPGQTNANGYILLFRNMPTGGGSTYAGFTQANFPSGFTWTTVTFNNFFEEVKDGWVASPGQWMILTTGGNIYSATGTTNTLQTTWATSNIASLHPSGTTLYALDNNRALRKYSGGNFNSIITNLPSTATTILDVSVESESPLRVIASFSDGSLQLNTGGGWTNINTNMKPSALNTVGQTYSAGENGEIYQRNGTVWDYQPHATAGITFRDLSDLSTLYLAGVVSGNNSVYTYNTSTDVLTAEAESPAISSAITELDNTLAGTLTGEIYERGTSSWTRTFDADFEIYAVDEYTADADLAAGQQGGILRKSGGTWSVAPNARLPRIAASDFGDASFLVAVGELGSVLTSADGGQNWRSRISGPSANMLSVAAHGTNMAVAGGENGTLIYSGNGGSSWQPASVSGTPLGSTPVRAIATGNGNTVLIIAGTRVLKSTNAGQNFANESLTLPATGYGIYLDADGYGFIVGDNGTAYRIVPNGSTSFTYTQISTDTNIDDDKGTGIPVASLRTVQFTDRLTGYITGTNGLVLKTTDGGQHWKKEAGGSGSGTPLIAMGDRENGSIVNANGSVSSLRDRAGMVATRFWYDELGRVVLSQNAKQFNIEAYNTAAQNQEVPGTGTVRAYGYKLYDEIGRVVEAGELLTKAALPIGKYESQVLYDEIETDFLESSIRREITRTQYSVAKYSGIYPGFTQENLRARVASVTYHEKNTSAYDRATHYSYDIDGNVKTLIQDINRSNSSSSSWAGLVKRIDYDYDLITGKVNYVYYQKNQPDQFIHRYQYDDDNRVTAVFTSRDGILWEQDATYQYYGHGLIARSVTGQQKVETTDHVYTLQGWTKGTKGENFSYALGYYDQDYKAINGPSGGGLQATPIARGLFNGNITTMASNTPAFASAPVLTQQFEYDQLNRINQSMVSGGTNSNSFRTNYTYDLNGNILTLDRYDNNGARLDQLAYNYEQKNNGYQRNTNQLRWVDDAVSTTENSDLEDQASDNYTYDDIGNLKKDVQEGIANIEWNVYGKVKKITRTSGSSMPELEFEYDALGNRVSKIVRENGTVSTTYYIRDGLGIELAIYTREGDGQPEIISENPLYGNRRIGISRPGPNEIAGTPLNSETITYHRIRGFKNYELTDHLDNVRVILNDLRHANGTIEIVAANEFYPFGMSMPGRSIISSSTYRYGFNGMEKDNEVKGPGNSYTTTFRQYDPRLGKWTSLDPAIQKYPGMTPYNAFLNSPIYYKDPMGDDPKKGLWERIVDWGRRNRTVVEITRSLLVFDSEGHVDPTGSLKGGNKDVAKLEAAAQSDAERKRSDEISKKRGGGSPPPGGGGSPPPGGGGSPPPGGGGSPPPGGGGPPKPTGGGAAGDGAGKALAKKGGKVAAKSIPLVGIGIEIATAPEDRSIVVTGVRILVGEALPVVGDVLIETADIVLEGVEDRPPLEIITVKIPRPPTPDEIKIRKALGLPEEEKPSEFVIFSPTPYMDPALKRAIEEELFRRNHQ